MTLVTPIILCGGSGTRLWPLSRKSFPKQFVSLIGDETLFQSSARRVSGSGAGLNFTAPIILTNADFRFIVAEQFVEAGIDPGPIMIEPQGRNTAPAVLAAAIHAIRSNPEAVLLVAPSDHVIPDSAAFHSAVARGVEAVKAGQLVTFGITPDRPETGYGYLKLAEPVDGSGQAIPLHAFVEKPDEVRASAMIAGGDHLWNAGIFLFAAKDILAAFETHAPELISPVRDAVDHAVTDLGFIRLDPKAWADAHDISIDCANTLLRSESKDVVLVGLGLQDIVAVATPDAVLVAHQSRAQDVKKVVDTLKAKGAKQATDFQSDHRPWGHFETLVLSDRFQVKRIVVKPGAALSLQSHVHRSEHWIVVSGTAKVTVDDQVRLVTENQSVYIPLGAVHRMENPGKVPMVLIEVQTGAYLGEDDIIRYEDIYARGQGAKG